MKRLSAYNWTILAVFLISASAISGFPFKNSDAQSFALFLLVMVTFGIGFIFGRGWERANIRNK